MSDQFAVNFGTKMGAKMASMAPCLIRSLEGSFGARAKGQSILPKKVRNAPTCDSSMRTSLGRSQNFRNWFPFFFWAAHLGFPASPCSRFDCGSSPYRIACRPNIEPNL